MKTLQRALVLGAIGAAMVFAPLARGKVFITSNELAQAAVYGASNIFHGVGAIGILQTNSWNAGGSAVLIDSNWVLLSAHQLASSNYDGVRFNLKAPGTSTVIARAYFDLWYIYPGYSTNGSSGFKVDLAVAHLATPITNVSPAVRCRVCPSLPVVMSMAGFGAPGIAGQTNLAYDGVLRAGKNSVGTIQVGYGYLSGQVGNQCLLCDFSFPSFAVSLEWKISGGDSGCAWGPVVDGQLQVFGIASFSIGDTQLGTGSGAINITLYNDWIDTIIGQARPTLSIQIIGSSTKLVWPSAATGFVLQTSADLTGTNWVTVSLPPTEDGTNRFILTNAAAPSQFFRLAQ